MSILKNKSLSQTLMGNEAADPYKHVQRGKGLSLKKYFHLK
jgi:hypothetical protein